MGYTMRALGLVVGVIALGCCVRGRGGSTNHEPTWTDAGTTDAGTTDAGTMDAGTTDAGTRDGGTITVSNDVETPEVQLPKLLVEAAPRYLIGFPLVIAVTYDNRSNSEGFNLLPELNILDMPWGIWGIGFQLTPLGGGAPVKVEPGSYRDEFPHGIEIEAGEQRRMLLDLSNFGVTLPSQFGPPLLQPGTYRFTLTRRDLFYGMTTSNPVTVELASPTPEDAQEATRLRKLGLTVFDNGGWKAFIKSNWSTVVPSPSLSFEAQRQLALHLFLHRAFYGPEPVAKLDEALLQRITEPSLAADVAAFRYEIHAARGAPDAKHLLDDLLARWPGMHYRFVPQKDRLGGTIPLELAHGRRSFGAEGAGRQTHPSIPYTK